MNYAEKIKTWWDGGRQALLAYMPKRKDKMVKAKQPQVVINHVDVRPINRRNQDIQTWRSALIQAENDYQQRSALYDLYADMLLDGHLKSVIGKRITAVTNRTITFAKGGKPVDQVTALTRKKFFRDFLKEALNSLFWGHTLMELSWPMPGDKQMQGKTTLIPRKHVKPKFGIVTRNAYDMDGLPYRESPWNANLVEIGDNDELGLILQAAQYVIYKRGSFGDWAEYAEVFGMPFRWATYNNEESRKILEEALDKAGSAGYVVAPQDAQLQFLTAGSQTSTDIFPVLRDACNEEIDVTILGNTMTTTEAKHSGYAQSQTHQQGQDEIHQDDRLFILQVLNESLTPYLAALGYPVEGGEWQFFEEETLSMAQRIEIDLKVSSMVPIAQDYWYETYKVPKPDPSELEDIEEPEDPEEEDDEEESPEQVPQNKTKAKGRKMTARQGKP